MPRSPRPWWYPRTRRARYGDAFLLSAATLAAATLLERSVHGAVVPLSIGAVAIAAILGGAGPGRLAAALLTIGEAVAAWPLSPEGVVRLAIFLAAAMFVAHASGWWRAHAQSLLTLRRKAARRLRSRLAFQRAIAQAVDEGIYAVDLAGRVTYLNAAAERMLGYRASELVGRNMKTALGCSKLDGGCRGEACRVLAVMSEGEPFRAADDLLTRKDGSRFPVRYSSAPVRRAGAVVGAVVAFQDVSAERRAESRERFLAAVTERLASTIDLDETLARVVALALPQLGDWCLLVLLEDGGAPRRVLVETRDPALEPAAREMLERYPVDLEADHGVGRVLRTGEPELIAEVGDFVGTRGTTVALRSALLARMGLTSFMAVPLRAGGRMLGAMGFVVARDGRRLGPEDLSLAEEVAGRCALAIDNARLHRRTQAAVQARDDMLALVSHDLRSPLGAVGLAAAAIARRAPPGPDAEPLRRSAATIGRLSERMGRLVGDLLDLAAIDSGRLSMARAPLSARQIAEEAVEAMRPLAGEAGVDLAAEPSPPSAPLVDGDRARVEQVLQNLLSNAVAATPRGGAVRVAYRRRGGHVVFSVADGGGGVPREERRRIFERYQRGERPKYRGAGLGLSIARGIVEAHGGRLWVASRRGRGACFRFSVPLAGQKPAPASALVPAG
jgi:PAS domain S-box-containing protein